MKRFFSVLSIAAVVSLTGCGSGGDSAAVTTSDLKGTWESICQYIPTTQTSAKTILEFTNDKFTRKSLSYSDPSCNTQDITDELHVFYNYSLGEDVTTSDNKKATEITTTITGFDLKKGNLINGDIPKAGDVEKSIILIDNNKLYYGEDKAPYQINYQSYLEKKNK